MEPTALNEATAIAYRTAGENIRATLAGYRLLRQISAGQVKPASDILRGVVPEGLRPLYERTEDLFRSQNEALERYIEETADELVALGEKGEVTLSFEEMQRLFASNVRSALEQYDRILQEFKEQNERARTFIRYVTPKELHPVLDQTDALLDQQYRTWKESVLKVVTPPSPETRETEPVKTEPITPRRQRKK